MKRGLTAPTASFFLTYVMATGVIGSSALASWERRGSRLTPEDRADLLRYAQDTWRSFERMTFSSGLPADCLQREGSGWGSPPLQTTPTDIAAYLWSVLAAQRLKLIKEDEAARAA